MSVDKPTNLNRHTHSSSSYTFHRHSHAIRKTEKNAHRIYEILKKIRIHRHKNSCTNRHLNPTALTEHSTTDSHIFNFDNTKVLVYGPNRFKLNVLELIYIHNNPANFRTAANKLNYLYNNILNKTRTHSVTCLIIYKFIFYYHFLSNNFF